MIDALEQAKQSKRGSKQSSPSQPANEEIDSNKEFLLIKSRLLG